MDKKKRMERSILELVWAPSEYAAIVEAERPDFRIQCRSTDQWFGVEVTELHLSESHARLHHIPTYFNEIIFEHRYRHKADKRTLVPEEVKIYSPDGKLKAKVPALIDQLPTLPMYRERVSTIIVAKNQKLSEYDKSLSHVSLVIYDAIGPLVAEPADRFFSYFFTPTIKDVLYTVDFREIYLITYLDHGRQVYIPLKMLLLIAEFHLFGKLLLEYPWETSEDQTATTNVDERTARTRFMHLFAKYLRSKTKNVLVYDDGDLVDVIFGAGGMVLKPEKTIHYYKDDPYPRAARPVDIDEETRFFLSDEFRRKEQQFLSENMFFMPMAFDVRSES